jgi:hypothetical protein
MFSYCSASCQSVMYCSKVCQKKDWKEHRQICKSLNAGDGAMQVRDPVHMKNAALREEEYKETERSFNDDIRQFFKLFTESTFEGSKAAARKMKKIAARQTKHNQKIMFFYNSYFLLHTESEKLLWPNSPLLVLLKFFDPNVVQGNEHDALQEGVSRCTLLHLLALLADPRDYAAQENQLTLGRQLIEHGANVNTCAYPGVETPLHYACHSTFTTNLDFIQLLLENGADPNAQDLLSRTPLLHTIMFAPGAAKCLLEWPTTDVNITSRNGVSFLGKVRLVVKYFSMPFEIPDNHPERAKLQVLLQQWRKIEEMLVERGAVDTGIMVVE